jgi:hypothetical protein
MLVPVDFRTATPDGEAEDAESGQHQPQRKILKDLLYVLHCYQFGGLIPPASLPDDAILNIQTNIITSSMSDG